MISNERECKVGNDLVISNVRDCNSEKDLVISNGRVRRIW